MKAIIHFHSRFAVVQRVVKREARREAILAAAAAAFAAKGFQGAGIAEIAAAADVAPANLYRYFPAKDAMVQAIVAAQRPEIAALRAASEAGRGPRAALLTFAAALVRRAAAPAMSALWLEILAEAARNPAIARLLREDDQQLRTAFTALTQRAIAAGEVRPGVDIESVARLAIALMDGLTARVGFDPDFNLEGGIAEMTDLLERALRP